jgi:hypothetical protein
MGGKAKKFRVSGGRLREIRLTRGMKQKKGGRLLHFLFFFSWGLNLKSREQVPRLGKTVPTSGEGAPGASSGGQVCREKGPSRQVKTLPTLGGGAEALETRGPVCRHTTGRGGFRVKRVCSWVTEKVAQGGMGA